MIIAAGPGRRVHIEHPQLQHSIRVINPITAHKAPETGFMSERSAAVSKYMRSLVA